MKKNGFTLIELLAVIIVLAIIALIATPIIFNVIENAKIKSMENSAYGVIDAVRTQYLENLLNSTNACPEGQTENCGGNMQLSGDVTALTVSGEKPTGGEWKIDNASSTADASKRGIRIYGVTFASMSGYTCSNTGKKAVANETAAIQAKVECKKDSAWK